MKAMSQPTPLSYNSILSPTELTWSGEGKGPCECYAHHDKIAALYDLFTIGKEGATKKALDWLFKPKYLNFNCTRFLLRLKDILKNPPKAFTFDQQREYWHAYGTLLGELIRRDGMTPITINSNANWSELRTKFVETGADAWEKRQLIIECVSCAVERCAVLVLLTSSDHFSSFWNSFGDFLEFIDIGFEVKEPQPNGLCAAFNACVFLSDSLCRVALAVSSAKQANLNHAFEKLADLNNRLLLHLTKTESAQRGLSVERWIAAVTSLLQCPEIRNAPGVQKIFFEIAVSLYERAKEESIPEIRSFYEQKLKTLIPALQNREEAPPRKSPVTLDQKKCKINFFNSENQNLPSNGVIKNICARTYAGFCIECEGVYIGPRVDHCNIPIEARLKETQNTVNINSLQIIALSSNSEEITFICRIKRAWPLTQGTGFALEHAGTDNEVTDSWKRYIDSLPNAGRYQPMRQN
jgi:hypothetical protein